MAKKKKEESAEQLPKIPVNEIEIGGVYKSAVQDLVRVESINEETQKIVVYNVSGAHRQWIDFRHIYLVEKVYQSR